MSLSMRLPWTSSRSMGTLSVWAAARAPDDIVDAFDWTWNWKKNKFK